jgi:hypothetical protein
MKLILGISFFCQHNSTGGEFLIFKQILVYWRCLRCFQVSNLRVAEDSIVFEFALKSRFLSSFGEEERHEEWFQTWQVVFFHWSIQLYDGVLDGFRQRLVEIRLSRVTFYEC